MGEPKTDTLPFKACLSLAFQHCVRRERRHIGCETQMLRFDRHSAGMLPSATARSWAGTPKYLDNDCGRTRRASV